MWWLFGSRQTMMCFSLYVRCVVLILQCMNKIKYVIHGVILQIGRWCCFCCCCCYCFACAAVAFVSKAIVILCWCVVVISLALYSWYYFNVDFVCLVYYFCMCFCFISNTIFNTNTFVNAWFWHSHWFFQWCTMIDWFFFSPFSKIKTSFFRFCQHDCCFRSVSCFYLSNNWSKKKIEYNVNSTFKCFYSYYNHQYSAK